MPLVEGLGDEVTIILGLLTIIIVLLIAWLSTHTRDIPFFSVIVVELSQRASRNQQGRRSQTPEDHQETTSENEETASTPVETIVQSETSLATSVKQSVSESLRAEATQNSQSVDVTTNSSDTSDGASSQSSVQNVINENIERSGSSESNGTQVLNKNSDGNEEPGKSKNSRETDSSEKRDSHENGTSVDSSESNENRDHNVNRDPIVGSVSANVTETVSQTQESEVRHRIVPSNDLSTSASDANSPSQNQSSDFLDSSSSDRQIRIRLKYLNDTQRLVYSSPTDTIEQFRRAHFSSELAANKLVRLIFNGQDMRNDTSTLQGYNITDNSVVHCLITQNLQGSARPNLDQSDADLQIGSFMMPLFGFVLAAVWYLRFTQRQYFNAISTLSLGGVTFLFLLGCASIWRNGAQREHQHVE